jgi:hypothetical protein
VVLGLLLIAHGKQILIHQATLGEKRSANFGESDMPKYTLESVILILIVVWLLFWLVWPILGGLIHLLLVIILVVVLIRLLQGKSPLP